MPQNIHGITIKFANSSR